MTDTCAKAILVTRNFPPLEGGMERLNLRLFMALSEQWQMLLIGPKDASRFIPEHARVSEVRVAPLWWFMLSGFVRCVANAIRIRPVFILAGSGLMAPAAYFAAKFSRSTSIVYLHGLDLVVDNRIYQYFWLPLIRRCDHVLVNSQSTARIAVAKGVSADKIELLPPGTDIPVLNNEKARNFRVDLGLQDAKILLAVGRLTARKGIAEFVGSCLPEIVLSFPNVVLLIIGSEASHALAGSGGNEKLRIQTRAAEVGVADNVVFLGRCDDEMLSAAYQAADVHVFPVQQLPGDVEGFGMVAVEAAAHGLQTVAFAVGGVSESVENGVSGDLIAAGDYDQFTKRILRRLATADFESDSIRCREFAESYSWHNFSRKIIAFCNAFIEK